VRDRVVHQLVSEKLKEIYEPTFIFDSFSSRKGKGTHKAVLRLRKFCLSISQNNKYPFYALKCDIKKFFDSVDHDILLDILKEKIKDKKFIDLLQKIIKSFPVGAHCNVLLHNDVSPCGIPLGNLTSQLFANIYLNKLDQFIKHQLKIKYYIRYTDDFIIIANHREFKNELSQINQFLKEKLKLQLHKEKIIIRKNTWGIDFLGYIILPKFILPRTKTKNRILKRIKQKLHYGSIQEYGANNTEEKELLITRGEMRHGIVETRHGASLRGFYQTVMSYLGYFKHCKSYKIQRKIKNIYRNIYLRYDRK